MLKNARLSWITCCAIALSATASDVHAKDLIKIEGSSTVYPITYQLAKRYMLSEGTGTQVAVGISGTGGGFRKFCRGRTDISNASRPIKQKERQLCQANGIEFIELPVAMDAITVVVNSENTWLESLSLRQLNQIWQREAEASLTSWSQFDAKFPNNPLQLHGPGPDSGTYDYFTEVTLAGEPSRQDYIANEDDSAMVAEVAADPNAMAFLGFAYYLQNQDKLKAVAISEFGGPPMLPNVENVMEGGYSALSRPLFIYVNKASLEKRGSVKRFLEMYLQPENIDQTVALSGYIPLSAQMYDVARQVLQLKKTGSVFTSSDMSNNFERFMQQRLN